MRIVARLLGVLLILCGIGAATAAPLSLSGEVTYRERIALPPGGTLRISLVDLAEPETPRVQAEAAIATPGQVPLSFNLGFDDSVLADGRTYGLRAEILSGGTIWFRNAEPLALDPGAPPLPLVVVTNFAGRIADPVAAADPTPLLGVTWVAEELNGQPTQSRQSTLSIAPDMRTGGRGACNSYFAQARFDGDALGFSAVAATRMACEEPLMAQEAAFFEALAATRTWHHADGQLALLDAGGKVVLRFSRAVR